MNNNFLILADIITQHRNQKHALMNMEKQMAEFVADFINSKHEGIENKVVDCSLFSTEEVELLNCLPENVIELIANRLGRVHNFKENINFISAQEEETNAL
jgi:hypothetical protein